MKIGGRKWCLETRAHQANIRGTEQCNQDTDSCFRHNAALTLSDTNNEIKLHHEVKIKLNSGSACYCSV
jgi:hypothetical protein